MKLKHCSKYILYIAFISCITLLSINLTNRDGNLIENKHSRIIIKSIENAYVPVSKGSPNKEAIRGITPETNGKSIVQPLPVPDTNAPIIISPLS